MQQKNTRVRNALKEQNMYLWELAQLLGVSEATITRKMRTELPEDEQNNLIEFIKKEGKNDV